MKEDKRRMESWGPGGHTETPGFHINRVIFLGKNDVVMKNSAPLSETYLRMVRKLIMRRRALGLTQRDVAQSIGVSRQLITAYESFQSFPSVPSFLAWIEALGGEISLPD